MKELVEVIAKSLVDYPDEVAVTETALMQAEYHLYRRENIAVTSPRTDTAG